MRRSIVSFVLATALGAVGVVAIPTLVAVPAAGADVEVPLEFGDGVYTDHVEAEAVEVDEQGRAVVLVHFDSSDYVMRRNPDGTLDESFGEHGVAELPYFFQAESLHLVDGAIVTAGPYWDDQGHAAAVVRLGVDGRPLPGFGEDGLVVMAREEVSNINVMGSTVLPDRSSVTVLTTFRRISDTASEQVDRLVRVSASGTVDPSYGGDISGAGNVLGIESTADGGVLLLRFGAIFTSFDPPVFSMASYLHRFDPTGRPDLAYGTEGRVRMPAAMTTAFDALPDGTALVAGTAWVGPNFGVVGRVLPDGRLDPTFGPEGIGRLPDFVTVVSEVRALTSGSIAVVAGQVESLEDTVPSSVLYLFAADGSVHRGFAANGRLDLGEEEGVTAVADGAARLGSPATLALTLVRGWRDYPLGTRTSTLRRVEVPAPAAAPTVTAVGVRRGSLSVRWTAAPGAEPLGYHVTTFADGTPVAVQAVPADVRMTSIAGLTDGVEHQVRITPLHADGFHAGVVATGTPRAGAPGPVAASGVRLLTSIVQQYATTLSWMPPPDDGGSAITGYVVAAVDVVTGQVHTWRTLGPDVRAASVTNLVPGRAYQVSVAALTAQGFGAPRTVVTVGTALATERQAPGAPAWVVAVVPRHSSAALVRWGAAREQGDPIAGFHVIAVRDGEILTWRFVGADRREESLPDHGAGVDVYVVPSSTRSFGTPAVIRSTRL